MENLAAKDLYLSASTAPTFTIPYKSSNKLIKSQFNIGLGYRYCVITFKAVAAFEYSLAKFLQWPHHGA